MIFLNMQSLPNVCNSVREKMGYIYLNTLRDGQPTQQIIPYLQRHVSETLPFRNGAVRYTL